MREKAERLKQQASSNRKPIVDFLTFKKSLYRRYQHAPHLALIDSVLMKAVEYVETGGKSGLGHIIISTPPRHGKSLNVARLFPSWFLATHPDNRVILSSYGATLAHKHSRYARNIFMSPAFQRLFPTVSLASDSKAADAWDLAFYDGGMDSMGVGGGVTGKGGHIIIIDDAIKSREEAESAIYRDKTWDWFTDDLYTRKEPGAAIILNGTRWHEDDLIGRAIKNMPGVWYELTLPALAEDSDPLGRPFGAALWEDRFPVSVLENIQRTIGEYSWSALYQQRPVPAEGGIFRRSWFEPPRDFIPEIVHAVRYWDLAMSSKTSADYTVGVKLGQGTDGHFYVLDVARQRLDWSEVVEFMAGVILSDGVHVAQGIEAQGYMSRAVQDLNVDPRLHGYQVWGYPVDKDKTTRALPFAAKCGADLVHLANAHWTQAYTEELCSFPNASHDDQVDASAGAWAMLDATSHTQGNVVYAEYGSY